MNNLEAARIVNWSGKNIAHIMSTTTSESWPQLAPFTRRTLYASHIILFFIIILKKDAYSSGIEWYVLHARLQFFDPTLQPTPASPTLQSRDFHGGCWQRLTNRRDKQIIAISEWKPSFNSFQSFKSVGKSNIVQKEYFAPCGSNILHH